MNFLKRVGVDLLKAAGIVMGFQPLIQAVTQTLPQAAQNAIAVGLSDFQQITNIVQTIEGGAAAVTAAGTTIAGPQKAILAGPAVAQAVLQSLALVGKKVKDPAAFQAACVKLAGAWADVQNAIEAL